MPVSKAPSRAGDRQLPPGGTLSLSELVERSGVPASTVHHYRRSGLIPPPQRCAANRFGYDERHLEALRVIRLLRERRGLSLDQIADVLPRLLSAPTEEGWSEVADEVGPGRERIVDAAVEAFQTRSYAEVSVSDIAEAAGVAKGSVYRHFASKEELFTAVIETLLSDTAAQFAAAVKALGGPAGLAGDPEKAAMVFGRLTAGSLPVLLELGARAAKGHEPSEVLARRVLRTLAEAVGQPVSGQPAADPIPAGLEIIEAAFSTMLAWAVGDDWPPDLPEPS